MRNHALKSKRRIAAVAIITTIIVGGGGAAAYAYWSAGGIGAGSVTAGTNVPITAVQTTVISNLAPGVAAQTLTGTFTNTNAGPVYVTSVTAAIGTVTKASGAPAGTCSAADFTLASATMTVGAQEASGTGVGTWTGATIAFNNTAAAQDACKGATVAINYTVL